MVSKYNKNKENPEGPLCCLDPCLEKSSYSFHNTDWNSSANRKIKDYNRYIWEDCHWFMRSSEAGDGTSTNTVVL